MTPHSSSIKIPLANGLAAYVNEEDSELVSGIKWRLMRTQGKMYARGTTGGDRVLMHRLLLKASPPDFVDHIDGNGLNNRRDNLRIATCTQNRWNAKTSARSLSQYKGVR